MTDTSPTPREFGEILAAEYQYIAQTAYQANEDRARVSSFYLLAVGSLVAAVFSTQFFDPNFFNRTVSLMFGVLFLLLTLLGTSTILQLARLRTAWYESMLAMNQLKDFVVSQNPDLSKAFRWKTSTLPSKYKTGSVSYYQAVEVALISALTFGTAVFFVQQAFSQASLITFIVSIILGQIMAYLQLAVYRRAL